MLSETDLGRIFLGCGNFGGVGSIPELRGKGDSREEAHETLNLARDLGIRRFDTASSYGGGLSEEYLGQWLRAQGTGFRSQILLATKVGNPAGTPAGERPLSRREVLSKLENSLRVLGTDYVDIYYLHQPDPATPIEETIGALSQIVAQGKVRSVGISNVGVDHVNEFLQKSDATVRAHLGWVQNEFSYLQQRDRSELLPLVRAKGLKYVCFSPLAGGLLTGKYQWGQSYPEGSRLTLRPGPFKAYLTAESFQRIEELKSAAAKNQRALPEEALRFLLDTEGVDSVVIGPRRKSHFQSMGFAVR